MIVKKIHEINPIEGAEGSKIRQIFHPHNTLNGIRYSISHSTVEAGKKSHRHKMKTSEVCYILEGKGILHLDSDSYEISRDHSVYIPPYSEQYIENTGTSDLEFLCIVDPAWRKEDEIIK